MHNTKEDHNINTLCRKIIKRGARIHAELAHAHLQKQTERDTLQNYTSCLVLDNDLTTTRITVMYSFTFFTSHIHLLRR